MRIALIDLRDFDYTPLTPLERPLGGMQSGISYLSLALAERGHDVTLINQTSTPGLYKGVNCVPVAQFERDGFDRFDAAISISCDATTLRRLGVRCPLVLWTGHFVNEADVQSLAEADQRSLWDRIVLKSNWQANAYCQHFEIEHEKIQIMRNAISPCFEQTPPRSSFFFETGRAPVLFYSSTPFRGLVFLLDAFPRIRAALPGCTARIYSSMAVYQQSSDQDTYGSLYSACRKMDGIEYCGSLNQHDLAEAISRCDVLAYPNNFPETSCITLMEAMASGCLIVSNAVAALPETGAGFGHFCAYPPDVSREDFIAIYADFTVKTIAGAVRDKAGSRKKLEAQMDFARTRYTWTMRAFQWEQFLVRLIAEVRSAGQSA